MENKTLMTDFYELTMGQTYFDQGKKDEYVYFEYSRKVSGTDYSYLTCVYDNSDEFWLVNFACYKELYKEYKSDFFNSADSVVFKE